MMSNPKPAITLTARLSASDPDFAAIIAMIEDWTASGHSRSTVIVEGLRALLGYAPRYADNAEGKLAKLQSMGSGSLGNIDLLLSQFDILNSRIDVILDKLQTLKDSGFSTGAVESVMDDGDLPPEMIAELRSRFNSVNG